MVASEGVQRVGFLVALPRILRDFAVNPADVLAEAGLASDALDDPEATMGYAAMGRLLRAGARRTGCPHLGLLVGQVVTAETLGLVGQLMMTAPTLGSALRLFVTHQHRNANGGIAYLLDGGERAFLGYAIYQPQMQDYASIYDGAAAAAFNIVAGFRKPASLVGAEVTISRPKPARLEHYHAFFGDRVSFGAGQTGISFPRRWLLQEWPHADAGRRRMLEETIRTRGAVAEADIVEHVRRTLRVGLICGAISAAQVAADLHLTTRTLDRRLAAAGAHFQGILDETRYDLARQLLSNTRLGIGEIGQILRYAGPSMFTRAFTRWAGVNPSAWRSERSEAAPADPGLAMCKSA